MIKKFDAPQSCRGLKTVTFPEKATSKNSKFMKECIFYYKVLKYI